jgi:demethylspheroidene O-methyltransferase
VFASTSLRPRDAGKRSPAGWVEVLYRARDRLLANPGFQRRASRLPLVRSLARRRAHQLHALTSGFVYSQVLFAGVRLGIFSLLQGGPLSVAEIARKTDLPAGGAERLLLALTGIGLLQRRQSGLFGLGELGAAMLGNPGIAAMVEHHQQLYADLVDPVGLLQERGPTRLSEFWTYAARVQPPSGPAGAGRTGYSDLMATSQGLVADHILGGYSFKSHRHLLDVAGGDGTFVTAALARWPHLAATVFDLPAVAEMAGERLADRGLAARATVAAGDMLVDPLPRGADLVTLVRVLHDHDDEPALVLLQAIHAVLPANGRLLIAEPMAGTRGAEAIGDTYFGMYLWAMGSGRPRTARELADMTRAAGFRRCREVASAMPMLVRLLVAER